MTTPATAIIHGQPVRYVVRRSRRARRVGVRVCRREGVVVILPWRARAADVPGLLERWADWLHEKVEAIGVRHGPRVRQYATGSPVLVLGRERRLQLAPLPAGRVRARHELTDEELRLELPPADLLAPRAALEKVLRKLAREDLPPRVDRWAERAGLHPTKVIVGERTSRWGSCSRRGTISLCYRLVMAPPEVIDSVVAHEICHLQHLNHSKRFYALLDRLCPGHREASAWLRDNEDDLIL
jgi:predicted metal-dependent hydrolase